ncbi:DMT family transporter [Salinispira pacifica]|uniref:Integral membrane domain protein n=1 Tax=Salinispira pacifica TaxID=1307761 RepID=V5WH07_9SPIO|nr:DMT family transporter [Salinispira pacifica]AHC15102.1 Integral membrane domain protein [Salinispira pacifica]
MQKQILLMLAASLSFAVMGVFVREAETTHVIWKVFFRNLVVSMLILASMHPSRWKLLLGRPHNRPKLLIRGISGTLGVLGFFIGLTYLPLANASLLNRLNPFFVALFSFFLLSQTLNLKQVISMILAFTGAVFIINPGGSYQLLPSLAALGSAAFAALAYTVIRMLGDGEDPRAIMIYFAGISCISAVPFLVIFQPVLDPTELWALLGIGVFAGLGQALLTMAYRGGHAATISVFGYSTVVFAGILGFFIYDETGSAEFFIGASFVAVSLLILYIRRGNRETS